MYEFIPYRFVLQGVGSSGSSTTSQLDSTIGTDQHQLDVPGSDFGSEGWGFESLRAH